MQKQKQNVKCHFFATDIPFKAQVHTFCPQLSLLVGLLSHREASPHTEWGNGSPRATRALKRMRVTWTLKAQGQEEATF